MDSPGATTVLAEQPPHLEGGGGTATGAIGGAGIVFGGTDAVVGGAKRRAHITENPADVDEAQLHVRVLPDREGHRRNVHRHQEQPQPPQPPVRRHRQARDPQVCS